jgi:hypothetical protein
MRDVLYRRVILNLDSWRGTYASKTVRTVFMLVCLCVKSEDG